MFVRSEIVISGWIIFVIYVKDLSSCNELKLIINHGRFILSHFRNARLNQNSITAWISEILQSHLLCFILFKFRLGQNEMISIRWKVLLWKFNFNLHSIHVLSYLSWINIVENTILLGDWFYKKKCLKQSLAVCMTFIV